MSIVERSIDIDGNTITIQTGKIQEYALFSVGIGALLALLILAINYQWVSRLVTWFSNLF